MSDLPAKIYDESDIERARRRGKLVGLVQGVGSVILVGVVLKLLGLVPTIAVAALVGYVLYKLLFGRSNDEDESAEE